MGFATTPDAKPPGERSLRRRQHRINASADVASRTGEEEALPTTIISIKPIFNNILFTLTLSNGYLTWIQNRINGYAKLNKQRSHYFYFVNLSSFRFFYANFASWDKPHLF